MTWLSFDLRSNLYRHAWMLTRGIVEWSKEKKRSLIVRFKNLGVK
nr:MAG TPA: hypothetical protein [Caudoviricetes sp.]